MLAAAGLSRLGRGDLAAFVFAFEQMLPAVGQGALAVEARAGDERVAALVARLDDQPTALAVRAERALLAALEGGCQVPIGAYAELTAGRAAAGRAERHRGAEAASSCCAPSSARSTAP